MQRTNIRDQALLYHITDLDNLESILASGLQPRSLLTEFSDVADPEILQGREAFKLEQKVPFHFFANNPFDRCIQRSSPEKEFIFLTVRRTLAQGRNWSVIPRHPLATGEFTVLDYTPGVENIDWDKMNERDYDDQESKLTCMAECLAPSTVESDLLFSIFVRTDPVKIRVLELCREHSVTPYVNVRPQMFVNGD
ncbi:DarT ssDNA thymidine ADP-ribosyltransferase family protein [Vibrio sp. Isolate24]|uniref:DarT ssDNA thymidine ADP-ribosyltransferase family protein n=1 Tax=Vibrio sp. Isolate24 TaxID=2908534 RepID=UPI001EFC8EED|nr:DarT ssDNA thymidine ADP-ribosyltransferase family protein [Vibrio sp. Isolate24]MCG9679726.1 DUF4433 domain-containing protein [Vibrio sp. Isolate24]